MQDKKNLHRLQFTDEEKGAPRLKEHTRTQETVPGASALGADMGAKRPRRPMRPDTEKTAERPTPQDRASQSKRQTGQEPAKAAERPVSGDLSKSRLRFEREPQPASTTPEAKRPRRPQQGTAPGAEKAAEQPVSQEQPKAALRPALSPESRQPKAHLRFDEGRKPAAAPKLAHDPKRPVVTAAHRKIAEVEDDNVGVESAHAAEITAEDAVHHARASHRVRRTRLKNSSIREAGSKQGKAYPIQSGVHSNPISRRFQRRNIQKQYAAARYGGPVTGTAASAERTVRRTAKAGARASAFVVRHKRGLFGIAIVFLICTFFANVFSSCSVLVEGTTGALASTSYPCSDEDLLGAEAAYCALEQELQTYLDEYETTHEYDEYHYDLDEIEHDPYVLLSYLTAWIGGPWTLDEVQDTLQMIFDRQYTLTENVYTEGEKTVCYVTLENFDLSHLPIYSMSEEQMSMYAMYMSGLGNRPDLFPDSEYVGKYYPDERPTYEIPPEALADETFARMMEEAQKYIGFPYVWGGYQPSTSFDCSGFVSWVINHSGWNYGRLGATALYYIGTPVSADEARPGDLVFFEGTYDTDGMSHCGIYLGNGMMIHAGDPIGYANLNQPYWQAHLAGFCRLPPTGG